MSLPPAAVVFRLDVSAAIGAGHLTRCLTLANTLAKEGLRCAFLLQTTPLASLLSDAGHCVLTLPAVENEAADAAACQSLLQQTGWPVADWLVIDHYGLGAAWQQAMRTCCKQLAVVDDLANRPHDADVLIDANEVTDRDRRYNGLLPAHCRSLLGSRYALLRPEFSAVPRPRDGSLRRVLVSFGGSDPANATTLALDALEQTPIATELAVDVVIGHLHPGAECIATRCARQANWTLHIQSTRMADLMQAADLCFGAAGGSTWERAALGLPSVLLTLADNQRPLAAALAEAGGAWWPGDAGSVSAAQLSGMLAVLSACPHTLLAMGLAARKLCDGRGAARVASVLLASHLRLRAATTQDEVLTLDWRNHPSVRRHSGDGQIISAQTHHQWLSRVLADSSRRLLIAELRGRPLAVLRFDNLIAGEPEISLYLDPVRPGQGWGSEVLRAAETWLRGQHPARCIHARINPDNHGSQHAFAAAGYQAQTQRWTLCL